MNVSATPQAGKATIWNTGTAVAAPKTDSPSDAVPFACELSQAIQDQKGASAITTAGSAKLAAPQHGQSASKSKTATNSSAAAVQTPLIGDPKICLCVPSDLPLGNLAVVPQTQVGVNAPSPSSSFQESAGPAMPISANLTPNSIVGQCANAPTDPTTTHPVPISGAVAPSAGEQANSGTSQCENLTPQGIGGQSADLLTCSTTTQLAPGGDPITASANAQSNSGTAPNEHLTPKGIASQLTNATTNAATTQPAPGSNPVAASANAQTNPGTAPDSPDSATQPFRFELAQAQASSIQAAMTIVNVTSTASQESPGLATVKAENSAPNSTGGPPPDVRTDATTSHPVPSSGPAQGSDVQQSNSATAPASSDGAAHAFQFELLHAQASSVQAAMKISIPTDTSSRQTGTVTEGKAPSQMSGTGDVQNHAKLSGQSGDSDSSQSAPVVLSSASSTATQLSGDWTPSSGDQGSHQGDPRSTGEQTAGKAHIDVLPDTSTSTLALATPASQAVKFSAQAQAPVSAPQSAPASADAGGALDTWRNQTLHAGSVVTAAGLDAGFASSEMHVQLRTEILGALDLHASLDGNRVAASIGVANSEAHALLASELPTLHQALASQNLQLEQVSILNRGGVQEHAGGERGTQSGAGSQPDRRAHSEQTLSQDAGKLGLNAAPLLNGEQDETYWESTRLLSVRA